MLAPSAATDDHGEGEILEPCFDGIREALAAADTGDVYDPTEEF